MTPSVTASRMTGFMAHLRDHGFAVGPGEAELVLGTLAADEFPDVSAARLAFKTMLSGDRSQWSRFDGLFDAYWLKRGLRLAERAPARDAFRSRRPRPELWDKILPPEEGSASSSRIARPPGQAEGPDGAGGSGRPIASPRDALMRTDLRNLVSPEDVAEAERIALRLARAMRYRLSRRRLPARRGDAIDLRRTIRRNLSRGGEPIELRRRHRPERPVRLVVLLDVSGSMKLYSRYFLSFVRGLVGQWLQAEAFLFHTRLVRVTEALRERDPSRAIGRLSSMTEGFDGGTRIAVSLRHFNQRYAKETLNSRSVVIVMSDGYDTDPTEALSVELERLKRSTRRLVWLNPLLGWRDYAPVARAMAAALDYIDCFATAHSLASLAALEDEFARL
ncbi:MAG: VWA domain-containing protein [Stellaceae bacterium]